VSDTFGLIPLLRLREIYGMGVVSAVVVASVAVFALLFAAFPRAPARLLVPLAVAVWLTGSTIAVTWRLGDESRSLRAAQRVGRNASWVDRAIGRDANAAIVYSADAKEQLLWQTEFWNRSVHRVLALDAGETGGLPRTRVSLNPNTGALTSRARDPRYVVNSRALAVDGDRLAAHGPWSLYRARQPLRLESSVAGIEPDGWMGSTALYTAYRTPGPAPSAVEIVLSRKAWGGADVPGHVAVMVWSLGSHPPVARPAGVLHSSGELRLVVPAPTRPFRVRISIQPTFSPARFGSADKRELTAIPTFRLVGGA
jgi:hypothetical protein